MNNDLKNIDIQKAVAAVIADDTDAKQIAESLALSLKQAQDGLVHTVEIPAVVRTRQKTGLSQNKFAKALRISPATLKSWEQGKRNPSGSAAALLSIIDRHPELIVEV
ncbi:MAG: helix-turn-helix domain-containing protein [Neisseriaceae bacterium]|nr:helix-turn-helix domain-containing protein [Neisseriaceae bacterium]